MAHLSLSIASHNFKCSAFFQILFFLFVSAHNFDASHEHAHVDCPRCLIDAVEKDVICVFIVEVSTCDPVQLGEVPDCLLYEINSSLVEHVQIIRSYWVFLKNIFQKSVLVFTVKELREFLRIEPDLRSFL